MNALHQLTVRTFGLCGCLLLSWSSQAQNVGIRTANPQEALDINGDVYVRGDDVYFSHDAAANANNDYFSYNDVNALPFLGTGMFHFHADRARNQTWDQPSASLSARGAYFTGRIGVGALNPISVMHVAGAGPVIFTLEADTDNVNEADQPRIDFLQDNRQVGLLMGFYNGTLNDGNTFHFGTRFNSTDNWTTMVIDTRTQHVGIGTNNPDQRLELAGGGLQINGEFGIGFAGDVPSNANVVGDAGRVYRDGNFGGTAVDFIVFEKTDINQIDPDGGLAFTNKGSDNVRDLAMVIRGSGRVGLQFLNPGYALQLNNNAAAGIGRGMANAWLTYSDGRLKSQRETIPYGLKTVMQLRPMRYFHANSTHDETGTLQIQSEGEWQVGFIAQELQQLLPEAVNQPEEAAKELWGVDYTRLVPVLTRAIQEQQGQIKALEQRCEQLEAQLNAQQP